jgi:hypothetical protein
MHRCGHLIRKSIDAQRLNKESRGFEAGESGGKDG